MENIPPQEQEEKSQIQACDMQNNVPPSTTQERGENNNPTLANTQENMEQGAIKTMDTEEKSTQSEQPLVTAVTEMNAQCHQKIDSRLVNLIFKLCIILASIYFFFSLTSIFLPPKQFNVTFFLCGMIMFGVAIYYRYIKRERLKHFQQGIIERYEFYKDYFLQRTLKNGVFVGEMRYSYRDVVNKKFVAIKGDAGYLILDIYCKYATRFYIHLKGMSTADLQQLQQLFAISLVK